MIDAHLAQALFSQIVCSAQAQKLMDFVLVHLALISTQFHVKYVPLTAKIVSIKLAARYVRLNISRKEVVVMSIHLLFALLLNSMTLPLPLAKVSQSSP